MSIRGVRRFFRLPADQESVQRDIDEEMRFHLESRIDALVRAGRTSEQARAQALSEYGDVSDARGELVALGQARLRRRRRLDALGNLLHDARLALRGLVREPGFSSAVVLTLGLGLGLNAAMFGITDRLLFRPPAHVVESDQVKRLYFTRSLRPAGLHTERASAYVDYLALARGVPAFASAAAYFNVEASVGRGQDARKIRWSLTTASFFPTLGVRPHIGRFYTEQEDTPGRPEPVVVLSHNFWKREFGGSRSALGRTLEIDTTRYTIIGVAPSGFTGAELAPIDVFVPMSAAAVSVFDPDWHTRGTDHWRWLRIIVRLQPSATPALVAAQADIVMAGISRYWKDDANARVSAESIILARAPGDWANTLPDTARIAFWLSGVSLLVLLIACANVTNLLLARLARRRREIGIRLALGVSRARLLGHFVIESVLLTGAGVLAGFALAHWGGTLMRVALLREIDWAGAAPDLRVLAYTAVLGLLCVGIGAAVPALQSLRSNLVSALKAGTREGRGSARTRATLVTLQATLCVLLLVGSGLFVKSLANLNAMPMGFDATRVLALRWNFDFLGLNAVQVNQLYRDGAERLRALPSVENAAIAMTTPFLSSISGDVRAEGVDSIPVVKDGGPYYNGVTPEYFATMGTRIVRGRAFTQDDGAPGRPAAIVGTTMARLIWPGQNPIGKCLYHGRDEQPPCSPVVGVAEDALHNSLEGEVLQYYIPLEQARVSRFRTLFVRTRGEPTSAVSEIRAAAQSLLPDLPAVDIRFIADLMEPYTRSWRLGAVLFSAFGALALLLAAIGLYSVIAYNVTQRAQEMSVRLALGARRSDLLALVLGDATKLVATGIVLGSAIALAGASQIAQLLFRVSPRDPLVFATVAGVLTLTGLVAALLPARRATAMSPMRSLRNE